MLPRRMPRPGESVFVINPRSGGRAGGRLLEQLRRRLGIERVKVIDALDVHALAQRSHGRVAALVACGGDGTAAALLEGAWQAAHGAEPTPVAVWPLGTGNDLARYAGAPLGGAIDARLAWLESATPRPLDRWLLRGPEAERAWFNYCSWGCDARISQRFHRLRDLHPWAFAASLTNRACYVGLGLQEPGSNLAIELVGRDALPGWLRSLVLANIPSYAGGQRLGARIDPTDGRCNAFALPAGVALGLGLSGVRRPRSLGTHRTLHLRLDRPAFLQIDGEPLPAQPGDYHVAHGGRVRLLVRG